VLVSQIENLLMFSKVTLSACLRFFMALSNQFSLALQGSVLCSDVPRVMVEEHLNGRIVMAIPLTAHGCVEVLLRRISDNREHIRQHDRRRCRTGKCDAPPLHKNRAVNAGELAS
jgi:hypothetical protein